LTELTGADWLGVTWRDLVGWGISRTDLLTGLVNKEIWATENEIDGWDLVYRVKP
jgi:hypothetical protein